jgi:secreted PhoX family phosphatase
MATLAQNSMDRRNFLQLTGMASLGFLGLHRFVSVEEPTTKKIASRIGYGDLTPDPQGILNLPKGFSYKVISRQGDPMTDGLLVPGKGDGMATFVLDKDRTILIRNHELSATDVNEGAFGGSQEFLGKVSKELFYDFGQGKLPSLGGTTTLIYNHRTQQVESQYLSLAGTNRNCAGGSTPWGSWLTCEEDVQRVGNTAEKDHGYVFEVPAAAKPGLVTPLPLKAMGRFNHEAVCVDPKTGIVYLTEDDSAGLIYRFLPNTKGKLAKGGKLQALALVGQKSADTRNWSSLTTEKLPANKPVAVEWIDMNDVEAPENDLRLRGFDKGAARFARGEGMWFGKNELYFACTNGGQISKGQIFRYVPSAYEGTAREKEAPGKLELFVEPNNTDLVKNCDNLTIAPWGDLIVCEDDSHPYVVGITPRGEFYRLAENAGYPSEFAGGVFSPDGNTYFVNIQHAGLTLAITGPWRA